MKLHLLLLATLLLSSVQKPALAAKKAYIVYLGSHSHGREATSEDFERAAQSHHELLDSVLGREGVARSSIFYSYTKHINGFAAMLEDEEAMQISTHPQVVSVFENREMELHTTRSWDFMGGVLNKENLAHVESIWARANYGEDVIIANLDTGVWPESASFTDQGYGPVPKRWKGICQDSGKTEQSFRCNRKLIGARVYNITQEGNESSKKKLTARDTEGHGTHTLSTAGGDCVRHASIYGHGEGTARGGSPRARVAAYKVCWDMCSDANVLAAFDDAIHDGVDVISVSLGAEAVEYVLDGLAIGAFHAVARGVTVVASAGNSGPLQGTVQNVAPWIFTVAASTIDRSFTSFVTLGNNRKLKGASLASESLPPNNFYPLIDGGDAKLPNATRDDARFCYPDALDPEKVRGKIVLCTRDMHFARVLKGVMVKEAGGVGMILADEDAEEGLIADIHFLPASMITYKSSRAVRSYLKSSKSPTASISPVVTQLGVKPAPAMASFSSRGPNLINPEFLKPDITAPGVNIIAAFTGAVGPTMIAVDERRVPFDVMSGTSMSCPHIAGVAGLVKKVHPDWSPAAIRSAIMTTARTRDNTKTPMKDVNLVKATPLDYGAGHVRPNRAVDPGLLYDMSVTDYVNFLCTRGYNSSGIAAFVGKHYRCPAKPIRIENMNYPSIAVPNLTGSLTVSRTVKNVGSAPATYRATVRAPYGVSVRLKPAVLRFEKVGEEKTFRLRLRSSNASVGVGYVFGGMTWTDGKHYVRSPLAVNAFS